LPSSGRWAVLRVSIAIPEPLLWPVLFPHNPSGRLQDLIKIAYKLSRLSATQLRVFDELQAWSQSVGKIEAKVERYDLSPIRTKIIRLDPAKVFEYPQHAIKVSRWVVVTEDSYGDKVTVMLDS